MLSNFKKLSLAFVLLSSAVSYSHDAFAIPSEEESRPSSTQLARFINGQNGVSESEFPQWVSHSYQWLNHLYTTAVGMPEKAKAILGFANLSARNKNTAFPDMDVITSTRFTLGRLQEIIDAAPDLDAIEGFKRYRNHARVFFGDLVTNRLRRAATPDELEAAWDFLSEIDGGYTKIGKIYKADLLLNLHYLPQGMRQEDVLTRASQLLEESYSHRHASTLRALITKRQAQESAEVPGEELSEQELEAPQPDTLHTRRAQEKRRTLQNQITKLQMASTEEGGNPTRKRSREDIEQQNSISEDTPGGNTSAVQMDVEVNPRPDSVPSSDAGAISDDKREDVVGSSSKKVRLDHVEKSEKNSNEGSSTSNKKTPMRKAQAVRSWMQWRQDQIETLTNLWNLGTGIQDIRKNLWNTMTEDQRSPFTGQDDTKFQKVILAKPPILGLNPRRTINPISPKELNLFVSLRQSKSKAEITVIMNISEVRYEVLYKKAKREGKI